jgi:predicted flap endonuclease-1-like 5' DNA nuclease
MPAASEQGQRDRGWVFGLFLGFSLAFAAVLWLIWLLQWLRQQRQEPDSEPAVLELTIAPEPPDARGARLRSPEEEGLPAGPRAATGAPDDLARVEGIGPKISSLLQEAGILTFDQLASSSVGEIERILQAESPRLRQLADATTWPEQASLAAAGDWEGLEALQAQLKGGRRV